MQSTVTFEDALASDAETLADIRVEAMQESLERIGRFDPLRARDRFLSGFSPALTRHIVFAGKRVGFFVVRRESDGLKLDHLYIRPSHQGRGIGSAVLKVVFAQADHENCPVRVGALKASNSNNFYMRHGFVLIEQAEFDNYYIRQASGPK